MKKIIKWIWIIILVVIGACVGLAVHFNLFGTNATLTKIDLDKQIQTEYHLKDQINLNGAKIIATYSNKQTETIDITSDRISGFDTTTAGTRTLTITYKEKTKQVSYTVVKTQTTIQLLGNIVTEYKVGDSLSINNAKLLVTYDDNSTEVVNITSSMISGFNTTTAGTKNMAITTSQGKTLVVSYTVASVSKIELIGTIKTEYKLNESLDTNNAKILVTYSNDETKQVDLTQSMIIGFYTTSTGTRTLTISYQTKTLEIEYTVASVVSKIELTKALQTEYQINDDINTNNAKILVTYSDDSTSQVDLDSNMISGFNTASIGAKTLTIEYQGATLNVNYNVNIPFGNYMLTKRECYDSTSGTYLGTITSPSSKNEAGAMWFTFGANGTAVQYANTDGNIQQSSNTYTWNLSSNGVFILSVPSNNGSKTETISFSYSNEMLYSEPIGNYEYEYGSCNARITLVYTD